MVLVNSIFILAKADPGLTVFFVALVVAVILYQVGKAHGWQAGEAVGRRRMESDLAADREALKDEDRKTRANCAALKKQAQELISRANEHFSTCETKAAALLIEAQHALSSARKKAENAYADREKDLRKIVETALSSHPNNAYLAVALDKVYDMVVNHIVEGLEFGSLTGREAKTTAKRIEEHYMNAARAWRCEARFYKLQTSYYESLFPELLDYVDKDTADVSTNSTKTKDEDWLSDDDYSRLSSTEKSQLALDRYVASHNKSKWQIGRDYELYIGHCFRRKKFTVEHIGMEKKFEDMGRDLICRSNPFSDKDETLIVQCKYWSSDKLIHEKHIMQLFGTTVEYALENKIALDGNRLPSRLRAVLVTSTKLSDVAKRFASVLGVEFHEQVGFPDDPNSFPRIKCNKESMIYHLPFDEQYDTTKIVPSEGDCFVATVAEAERLGFRRAYRFYRA